MQPGDGVAFGSGGKTKNIPPPVVVLVVTEVVK